MLLVIKSCTVSPTMTDDDDLDDSAAIYSSHNWRKQIKQHQQNESTGKYRVNHVILSLEKFKIIVYVGCTSTRYK